MQHKVGYVVSVATGMDVEWVRKELTNFIELTTIVEHERVDEYGRDLSSTTTAATASCASPARAAERPRSP